MISVILLLLLCGFLRSLDLFGLGRASEYVSISIHYHFLDFLCVYRQLCVQVGVAHKCACNSGNVEVKAQLVGVGFLWPRAPWGLNSGQVCRYLYLLRHLASQFSWFFPFNVFPVSYEAEAGYSCILVYAIQFSFPSLFKWWQEWGRETRKRRR